VTIDPAWPPVSGAEIRNWENARAAAQFGAVTVASVVRARQPEPFAEGIHLASLSEAESADVFRRPADGALFDITVPPEALARLEALLDADEFDLAVIETPALHPLLPIIRARVERVVLDLHNIDSDLHRQLRPAAWWWLPPQARRMAQTRRIEEEMARAVDEVWVCSDADGKRLRSLLGWSPPLRVLPNIVPTRGEGGAASLRAPNSPGPVLLFQGHLSYRPNVEAARLLACEILPLVRKRLPDVRVVLAGRAPHRHVAALSGPHVEVVADPPDLAPIFSRADLVVLPIRAGSGTRIKALEALAWGLPIVATPLAVEGLEVEENVHCRLATSAQSFAEEIHALWNDPGQRHRQAEAGRALVARCYTRSSLQAALAPVFAGWPKPRTGRAERRRA
jgi:glycosyltransferase involved in cell wall biosynthesis